MAVTIFAITQERKYHFWKGRLKVQPVITTDTIDNFINEDRQI
jgi:hypothetical protein